MAFKRGFNCLWFGHKLISSVPSNCSYPVTANKKPEPDIKSIWTWFYWLWTPLVLLRFIIDGR